MDVRKTLALKDQLVLPMIPFFIDTCARGLVLRNKFGWYEIPDMVTLLATYAFFCLGVMLTVNPHHLKTDSDAHQKVESVRKGLLIDSVLCMGFAGVISVLRAIDELHLDHHPYKENCHLVAAGVIFYIVVSAVRIIWRDFSYINAEGTRNA